MATDENPCYSLEAPVPALNYAIRAKPSPKQAAMCRMAVELHTRIDRLSSGQKDQISEAQRIEDLTLVVNAFVVGGVIKNCDTQTAVDQLLSIQKRVFTEYFSPILWNYKQRFVLAFLVVGFGGIGVALLSARVVGWTEVANYAYFATAAAFGVTIVSAGRGLHHDFAAFDDDVIALQRPFIRLFLGSGVALVVALALSTDAATLKLGNMATTDVPSKTNVALALGALLGIANLEAFRLIVRFASQAIGKISTASARS